MPALPWGLTPAGFRAKTLAEIQDDLEAQLKDGIRDSDGRPRLNVKAGPIHQIVGTVSSAAREVWEVLEAVHAATDRDRATGAALRSVAALTGTTPIGATKSRVTGKLALAALMTLPRGSIVSVAGSPTSRFLTLADVVTTGAGYYEVELEAETAGPVAANAGTLTVIETPVTGWASITNELDAVQGQLAETDPELRSRTEDELAAQGTSPRDAIRADLLQLLAAKGVTDGSVTVYMNVTDATDVDGLPPHSVEAVVYDGTPSGTAVTADEIAQVLWDTVGAGIATYGTSSGTATDSVDVEQVLRFTRPTPREVWIASAVNVATSRGWDAVAGEAEVVKAVLAAGRAYLVGDDVSRFRLLSSQFSVPGLIDCTAFTLGFSSSPVGTDNLVIGKREIAAFDSSRVIVTPTLVTPP